MRSEKQERKGKIYPTECRVQRIGKRDKSFFNEECNEVEGNNRMGKTGALFKKIGNIKGTFHAKMGAIKDRNGKDITRGRKD